MADKLYEAAYQDSFLAHALSDSEFLRSVAPTLDPDYFSNELAQRLLRVVLNFHESEKSAPGRMVGQVLNDLKTQGLVNDKLAGQLAVYSEQLLATPLEHKRYLLERYDDFIRYRKLAKTLQRAVEFAKKEDLDKADELIKTYVREREHKAAKAIREAGFFDPDPSARAVRRILKRTDELYFLITPIDRLGIYLSPGELCIWMSQFSGAGKSWALMHCALASLIQGRRILYLVIGEMTREQIEDRFDTMISGLSKPHLDEGYKLHKRLQNVFRFGGNVWIECLPAGAPTVQDLKALAHELANAHSFSPNVVVVDYMDNISHTNPNLSLFEQGDEIAKALKGWAQEERYVIFTACQGNRQAQEQVTATQAQVGGSRGKYQQADVFLSVNRTAEEAKLGVTRVFVDKARNFQSQITVTFKSNFETGQFYVGAAEAEEEIKAEIQKPKKRRSLKK